MGTESVIVARDRDGQVHALLNSCTHRGMKVCRHDHGKAKVFTCPYHGWSFSNDGRLAGVLIGVPHFDKAYRAELRREDWGLRACLSALQFAAALIGMGLIRAS